MGNHQKPDGFDWSHMEKFLGEQIPFMPKGLLKNRMDMNASWVGDYVQEVLKKSFGTGPSDENREDGPAVSEVRPDSLDYEHEVFETHNSVIVRVKIPEPVHHKNIRAYAANNQLKLEKEPSRQKQYIPLPATVEPGAGRGVYKDRVLELRLPKLAESEMYQEIRIRNS